MATVLLDTHVWAWSLLDAPQLSAAARQAMETAAAVRVSPISFFEIGQKIRFGKWAAMAPYAGRLTDLLAQQGGLVAPLTPAIALRASLLDWAHRDPFDRFLAATAELSGDTLISADPVFDAAGSAFQRLW